MAENNKNIEILVEELIKLTNENKIQWEYTDNNPDMLEIQQKVMNKCIRGFKQFFPTAYRNDNCFYTNINNGYIFVIEWKQKEETPKNYLAIIPYIDAKDMAIYDSPQSQIIRLHSLILKQFPTVEDYITDIFNTFKKMST